MKRRIRYEVDEVTGGLHAIIASPSPVLKRLIECVSTGSLMLDPFAGSATTGVACALTGGGSRASNNRPSTVRSERNA